MSILTQQLYLNTRDVFNQESSLPQPNVLVNPSGSAVVSANLNSASQTINLIGSIAFPAVAPGASAILNLQGSIVSNGSANVGTNDAVQILFGFNSDLTTTYNALTTVVPYWTGSASIGTSAPRGYNLICVNNTGATATPVLTATTTTSWTTNASVYFNTTACECFVNIL
jgi:hypothetical protein